MNSFRFTFITFVAGFLLSTVTLAQTIRQRSTTEGFSLGLSGHYMGWSSDFFQYLDENVGGGPGFGGRVGYGFTQRYEVFAQYNLSTLNTDNIGAKAFQFSHVTGGLRFNFSATTHALRPFAELGYTYQTGKVDQVINNAGRRDNIIFKGGALHVGAGLNYFVALPVAITLNGSIQAGAKSPVTFNGVEQTTKADVAAFRISAGVIVYVSELF